ncbi:MAG: amidohydrolase/deacetylase family metallohydrolase, partial [Acidobacteria bacterium]|nr:amidohydrolase/deacetylase family metallohydrolase [Acidobacteriota bacterium]
MRHHSRREFLWQTVIGSSCLCGLRPGSRDLLAAQATAGSRYDLVVKGGHVVDPAQGLSAPRDVGILGNRIAKVAPAIADTEARHVLDARGMIVTPGLIDVHVHVYDGVSPYGVPVDPNCIAKGVTTVVDAGSAGSHTFAGLRQYVINVASTRVYALLNISVIGLMDGESVFSQDNPYGELLNLRYADPKSAIRTIERHRDVVVGVKARLSRNIAGEHDLAALKLARQAAAAVGLPLMIHPGATFSPLGDILANLEKGDIVTHCFRAGEGGILDDRGRVLSAVRAAVARGVRLDVGHGAGGFSFETAERALRQDVLPGTISSDLHQFNVAGPVFDLATTLSKFLLLGLSLE